MKFLRTLGELLGLARKASAADAADADAQEHAKRTAGEVAARADDVAALILGRMRRVCPACRGTGYRDGAICADCRGGGNVSAGSR